MSDEQPERPEQPESPERSDLAGDARPRRSHLRGPGAVAVVVAVVVVAVTTVIFLMLQSPAAEPVSDASTSSPTAASTPSSTATSEVVDGVEVPERTLLLQIVDGDTAVGNLLIDVDADAARAIWLPRTMLVPTPQLVTLAQTPGLLDTLAATDGVSALLGVRVDATLLLDRLGLIGLVDAIGGAPLAVEEPIEILDAAGKVTSVILPGEQVLSGVAAATYALSPSVTEDVQAARMFEIIQRVARGLPSQAEEQRALLLSLGSSARSSVSNDEIVAILAAVRDAAMTGDVSSQVLPVVVMRSASASLLAQPEGGQIVAETMPNMLLEPAQSRLPRVVLRSGGASAVQMAMAASLLTGAGAAVVEDGVLPETAAVDGATRVFVPNWSAAVTERVGLVRDALGLSTSTLRRWTGTDPAPVDVVVELGRDFTVSDD